MKADRLLSVLLQLQAHGRLTSRDLASKLEVSERTVHRDMEALSASGVPVYALRGSRGGWQLDEDWRTQVPGLDEIELRGLMMAQPRIIGDAPLAAAAERAYGKLMAALPMALRGKAASIRQRLYVDIEGWHGSNEDLGALPVVQDAVARDRKLRFQYCPPGRDRSERIVDPLGLVAKGSSWYLVAQTPRGFRTYRVSRIEEPALLDAGCERPAAFDLAAWWKNSMNQFRGIARYEVLLRLERKIAKWLITRRTASIVEETDDHLTMRIQFDDEHEACFVALGMGSRVEVVAPAKLRQRVLAEAAAVAAKASAQ